MTCYVDDVRHRFGRMIMCHLWADTLEELLQMVDTIGVERKWIQGHPELSFGKHRSASWVHFDISLTKKDQAIRAGAVLTDMFGPVEHVARLDIATGDPQLVEYGQRRLQYVERARATRVRGEFTKEEPRLL